MFPYTENPIRHTRGRTRNWRDSLNIFDDSHLNGYNPVFKTHLLGGVVSQGVIAYITMVCSSPPLPPPTSSTLCRFTGFF
jgi:hypothetical protein